MIILKKILSSREFILLLIIIILTIIFSNKSDAFLTIANLKGLFANISVYSIIAIGMTILFISGNFDISVGTHFSFLGVVLGVLLGNGLNVYLAILLIIILGIISGSIMGMLVAKFELNPFIVTLAAMFIFKGLSFLIGRTSKVSSSSIDASFTKFPENFPRIGGGYLFGKVQYINIYMIIILIFLYFLLERNVFFRQNFFIGGNEQAAILAGIKTKLLIILNFALVSTLVAISIILRFSRWQAASANLGGESLGLFVLGAVIIGGGSLKGGVGSIIGTFLGVSLLTIINTGITIIGMDPLFGDIFLAGILMFSILLDKYSKKLILK